MPEFRLVTDIEAPIERVFDLARDIGLHQAGLAHTGERVIAGRTSGPIEAGETVTWRARHLGLWWTLTSRITECESPTRFADEQLAGPFAWFRHEHRFEATPTGTRMTDHWRHVSPFGILGRVADRLVLTRHLRRMLQVRNAHLKRTAESA
jgi:ligand-binding SRPBCC domain-containing protein